MRPDVLLIAADREVRGRRFTPNPIGSGSSREPASEQELRRLEFVEACGQCEWICALPAVPVRIRVREVSFRSPTNARFE